MFNNKLFISCGGIVAVLPAKPILILAVIDAIMVWAATYCIFNVSDDD